MKQQPVYLSLIADWFISKIKYTDPFFLRKLFSESKQVHFQNTFLRIQESSILKKAIEKVVEPFNTIPSIHSYHISCGFFFNPISFLKSQSDIFNRQKWKFFFQKTFLRIRPFNFQNTFPSKKRTFAGRRWLAGFLAVADWLVFRPSLIGWFLSQRKLYAP